MRATASTLKVKGLGRRDLRELGRQAKKLGITPEEYAKEVLEERLEMARSAKDRTLAEIVGPAGAGQGDDPELDRLIEAAREHHHRRDRRKG